MPGDILDDIPCKYVNGAIICEVSILLWKALVSKVFLFVAYKKPVQGCKNSLHAIVLCPAVAAFREVAVIELASYVPLRFIL